MEHLAVYQPELASVQFAHFKRKPDTITFPLVLAHGILPLLEVAYSRISCRSILYPRRPAQPAVLPNGT